MKKLLKILKIVGATAAFNVLGNALLIPRLGVMGAAIATAISAIALNLAMLIYVMRKQGINPTILAKL